MSLFEIVAYLVVFISGALFTFLTRDVIPFEYKRWREDKIEENRQEEEWKESLRSVSENVVNIRDNEVEGAEERNGTIDRERLQRKMVVIADQLQELKSSNTNIEDEVEDQIDDLINSCREVDDFILAIGPSNYEEFKDKVRDAADEAEDLRDVL